MGPKPRRKPRPKPPAPPTRPYGDRFIPFRYAGETPSSSFGYHVVENPSTTDNVVAQLKSPEKLEGLSLYTIRKKIVDEKNIVEDQVHGLVNQVLKSEIFGRRDDLTAVLTSPKKNSIFQLRSPTSSSSGRRRLTEIPGTLSGRSVRLLQEPRRTTADIEQYSFKTLDAQGISDDFYTSVLDWSVKNVLAIPLLSTIFLWQADTKEDIQLGSLPKKAGLITCARWMQRGTHLAVAGGKGEIFLWDVERNKCVRSLRAHQKRVGTMSWNDSLLVSGSLDRTIAHYDVRIQQALVRKDLGHAGEICSLTWSPESTLLASGGNDNKVMIWDQRREGPLFTFTEHTAAVKALAWSPHKLGLLASGGGKKDKTIQFWNVKTGVNVQYLETNSQICNLAWCPHLDELVSSHGYDENALMVWRHPSLLRLCSLYGHKDRVLHMCLSPDGTTVCTSSPDESLRFWRIFPPSSSSSSSSTTTSSSYVHATSVNTTT